jgi:hypothetical protein
MRVVGFFPAKYHSVKPDRLDSRDTSKETIQAMDHTSAYSSDGILGGLHTSPTDLAGPERCFRNLCGANSTNCTGLNAES